MSNAALNLPLPQADEDEFEVEIIIRSRKYDCHTAYRLNKFEIENDSSREIMLQMTIRLQDYIQEKLNATSEGKEG